MDHVSPLSDPASIEVPDLATYLASFVTPERKARMTTVLTRRTRHITVVLEDLFQPHNASAVLRTCDGLGIQDVHIVEKNNTYRVNPEIALGASQWLTLHRYRGEQGQAEAYAALRQAGYRIVATTPHTRAQTLDELDLARGKVALVFGTELSGLSPGALESADEYVYIPMEGFVESFNISVSAAICLHHLGHKLRTSGVTWELGETEREAIWLQWLKQGMKNAPALERRYHELYGSKGGETV